MHSFPFVSLLTWWTGFIAFVSSAPTDYNVLHKRISRTSAPSGCLTVGAGGKYSTISAALTALGSSTNAACIYIAGGIYEEQLSIKYGGALKVYGETTDTSSYSSNQVSITHSISSTVAGTLDKSSTVDVTSANTSFYNINITNGYGQGTQAVAVTANANQLAFYGCSFTGYQDTLYAKSGTQYYSGCLIQGAVDYIFGAASAWFTESVIMSIGGGAITADSREDTSDTSWYVFDGVNVTSNRTDLKSDVYLGRPWRVLARVKYQNSYLSNIVNAAGWTTMAEGATPLYYEYENTGPGASTSARKYETSCSSLTSIETVLGSDYQSWVDTTVNTSIKGSFDDEARSEKTPTAGHASTTEIASVSACTPSSGGSSSTDDTPAIASAIKSCGAGGTIVIPARKTFYLNSVLDFTGCNGCDFQIEGTLKASNNLGYWEGKAAIMYLKNIANAKIRSVTGSGVIDGNGQAAWDEFSSNSSYQRPTLVYTSGGSGITFSGFSMVNPPNVFHSANGDARNILYTQLNLSAISTSSNPAHNTDGFDVGPASYVTYTDITVLNDDDCVAFKPGASFITVNGITCTGSHGLSVGSLGKSSNDSVSNVYVSNATMINSAKAVGIKTYPSGDGHGQSTVTNVTYTGIKVQNCDYAIQIQSCYSSELSYCASNPGNAQISDVVFENFSGTTSKSYAPATSNLDCGANGECGIKIENYAVTSSSGTSKVLCANTPSDLGVTCSSGASG